MIGKMLCWVKINELIYNYNTFGGKTSQNFCHMRPSQNIQKNYLN